MALPLSAQTVGPLQDLAMDHLHLQDGSQLSGMLLEQSPRGTEFLEINRPPGKPMFAVIHTVSSERVLNVEKISGPDRQQLAVLVDHLRNRTQIREAEKSLLQLVQVKSDVLESDSVWQYSSDHFVLTSPLEEDLTRTLALRLDQIFQAFEHWMPPATQPHAKIQIIVFDSISSYSAYLRRIGLQIDNPAVYVPHTNQVLIGSDLGAFQKRLALIEQQHAITLQQWQMADKELSPNLNALAKQLKDMGWSPNEIASEVQSRREAWQRDYRQKQGQIQTTNRRNQAQLRSLLEQTTQHLCHESFHAYVENFLFPQDQYDVPVWLNEGLAQLFEHAQFENASFRIDQPPRKLLAELKARIERDHGLGLQRMLQTESGSFLLFENLHKSQLDYDVAWGLAWYLVFQKELFTSERLEKYVHRRGTPQPTIEDTFGEPVSQLQANWVDFMRKLEP
ncbi:DUF1570 domain-containing protein [Bremerella cremea]|nr:DUF1570 domain-containing protein [Bremerella cremea]